MSLLSSILLAATMHGAAAGGEHDLLKGYCDDAQTQYDMNQCAGKAADAIDRELNATYQAVLRKWANHPAVVGRLRDSQRAWLSYRDADIAARFAFENGQGAERGTIASFAEAVYAMGLEHERTLRLCEYLRGLAEGEVDTAPCAELAQHPFVIPPDVHSSKN